MQKFKKYKKGQFGTFYQMSPGNININNQMFNNSVGDATGAGCSTSGGVSCGESLEESENKYANEVHRILNILQQYLGDSTPYNVKPDCQIDINAQVSNDDDFWDYLNSKLAESQIDYEKVDEKDWSSLKQFFNGIEDKSATYIDPFNSYLFDVWKIDVDNPNTVEDEATDEYGEEQKEYNVNPDVIIDLDAKNNNDEQQEPEQESSLEQDDDTTNESLMESKESYIVVDDKDNPVQTYDNAQSAIDKADELKQAMVYKITDGNKEEYYISTSSAKDEDQDDTLENLNESTPITDCEDDSLCQDMKTMDQIGESEDMVDELIEQIISDTEELGKASFDINVTEDILEDFINLLEYQASVYDFDLYYDVDDARDGFYNIKGRTSLSYMDDEDGDL